MNNDSNEINELNKKIDVLTKKVDENNVTGNTFTYNEYRIKVVKDDIEKLKEFNSILKWVWFIPIIGVFKYLYDLNIIIKGFDRGIVRQELNKAPFNNWRNRFFVVIMFLFNSIMLIFNLYVFVEKKFIETAIKNSQKRLYANAL